MNESIRTITFVGAAALIGLVAWVSRPVPQAPAVSQNDVVKPFDVADANSFKIERYDPDEQKLVTFEVTKQGGRWLIPSHDNYPADAQSQLQKVASFFTGMKAVGSKQSSDPKQHGSFGVLQPTAETSGDAKQYGSVVTITDSNSDELVHLIVGKSAKPEGSDDRLAGAPLRFVRQVGQDDVYVVEISLDAITTKFADWIEQDLLKLSSFDVAKLNLHDYSILPERVGNSLRMAYIPRMDTVVNWNATSNEWELQEMLQYQKGKGRPADLADDEELNKTKLDGVKTAVDDLKIVDVDRKPKVLFDALADEKLARDEQALTVLQEFGFYVMADEGSKKLKVVGSNGGLSVSMKDGVKYNLYFGDPKSAEKGDSTKLNRYLMVQAELDESMIPKPKLEAEDEPLGPDATEKPEGDKPEEGAKPEGSNPEDANPEDNDETSEKADDAALKGQDETSKDDEAKPDGDAKDDEEKKPSGDAETKRRETIKKENKRKMDEYQDKRKKAETRVAELNARFNDWFYVVSDDVYRKVQLVRADIVKDRATAKEEGFGVDAFRQLEQGGVKGKAPAASTPPATSGGFPGGFPNM
jgi:hypothetical protein